MHNIRELNGINRLAVVEYITKHITTAQSLKEAEEFLINLNERAAQSEIDP